jgi:hypothetical protein
VLKGGLANIDQTELANDFFPRKFACASGAGTPPRCGPSSSVAIGTLTFWEAPMAPTYTWEGACKLRPSRTAGITPFPT